MKEIKLFECNQRLLERIRDNLKGFDRKSHAREGYRQAAVAVTIVDEAFGADLHGLPRHDHWSGAGALILTRRAARLKHHAGQWSFPGGRVEAGENTVDTALRELKEEVGLDLERERVIGFLDDFTTRSGFVITPVVLWGGPGLRLTPNPAEVASIHRIPIAEFMRPDAPILEELPESRHPLLFMPVGSGWIAAPTAALIFQFREVAILGRPARVAHYEQPLFAWK